MNDDKKDHQQSSQPSKGAETKPKITWSEWFPRESGCESLAFEVINIKGINVLQLKDEKK